MEVSFAPSEGLQRLGITAHDSFSHPNSVAEETSGSALGNWSCGATAVTVDAPALKVPPDSDLDKCGG